jgi:hypothetical protein
LLVALLYGAVVAKYIAKLASIDAEESAEQEDPFPMINARILVENARYKVEAVGYHILYGVDRFLVVVVLCMASVRELRLLRYRACLIRSAKLAA